MNITSFIETIDANLATIPVKAGQLIYCTDTLNLYHDTSVGSRNQISDYIFLNTEADRDMILAPVVGKFYFVKATRITYIHDGDDWININSLFSASDTTAYSGLTAEVLTVGGIKCAPKTLAGAVYTSSGGTVESKLATITKLGLSTASVTATADLQKTFTVPFPFTDYIALGNAMLIHVGGSYISPERYTITGTDLTLNGNETGVELGRSMLFTFIFNSGNIQTNQLLDASYITNGSLNIEKASNTFFNTVKIQRIGYFSVIPSVSATTVAFNISEYDMNYDKLEVHMDRGKLFEGVDYSITDNNTIILTGITPNGSNKFMFEAFHLTK